MPNIAPMKKKPASRQQDKYLLDEKKFEQMLEKNSKAVIFHAYTEAVYLALKAKYGSGMIGHACMTKEAIAQMNREMAPLAAVLEFEAAASFFRVFNSVVADPQYRDYLRMRSASALGKHGGRPPGARAAHLMWLENAMRTAEIENQNAIPPLTAKEHFRELRLRPEIDGEDGKGNLIFSAQVLDKFNPKEGQKEPVVTLSAVTETLTRIRKTT